MAVMRESLQHSVELTRDAILGYASVYFGHEYANQYTVAAHLDHEHFAWRLRVVHQNSRQYADVTFDPDYTEDKDFREQMTPILEHLQSVLYGQIAMNASKGSNHELGWTGEFSGWRTRQGGARGWVVAMAVADGPVRVERCPEGSAIAALLEMLGLHLTERIYPQNGETGLWVVKHGVWARELPRAMLEANLTEWQERLAQIIHQQDSKKQGADGAGD